MGSLLICKFVLIRQNISHNSTNFDCKLITSDILLNKLITRKKKMDNRQ